MKLRTKFSLSISFLIVVILAGVSVSLFVSERNHLRSGLRDKLKADIIKYASIARESYLSNQDITLLNYVSSIKKAAGVREVIFVDTKGKVVMHSDLANRGNIMTDKHTLQALSVDEVDSITYKNDSGTDVLEMVSPVSVSDSRLGTARIIYDSKMLYQPIDDMVRNTGIRITSISFAAVGIGLLVAYILVAAITRPLKELSRGAQIIGRGNLAHRIELKSKDELGELSNEFNVMAEQLGEMDRIKDEFVDSVSHELRSPLAAIKGYLQNLEKGIYGVPTKEQLEIFSIIQSNAERLAQFVNDVLDIAKIKSGQFDMEKSACSFRDIAGDVVKMFAAIANEMKLNLSDNVPTGLPDVFVDADKIRHVVINLVNNAMKFTPSGGNVIISASQDSGFIRAVVSDTGVGIPKEKLSKVFDRFVQVKEAQQLNKKIKGTGLGLTISKNIVELHGGTIHVESEEGRGTSFIFTLPLRGANGISNSQAENSNS